MALSDQSGFGWESCERCGMGRVTTPDSAPWGHECPEPYSRSTAETLAHHYASSGIPISLRMKARIRLGLQVASDEQGHANG